MEFSLVEEPVRQQCTPSKDYLQFHVALGDEHNLVRCGNVQFGCNLYIVKYMKKLEMRERGKRSQIYGWPILKNWIELVARKMVRWSHH